MFLPWNARTEAIVLRGLVDPNEGVRQFTMREIVRRGERSEAIVEAVRGFLEPTNLLLPEAARTLVRLGEPLDEAIAALEAGRGRCPAGDAVIESMMKDLERDDADPEG